MILRAFVVLFALMTMGMAAAAFLGSEGPMLFYVNLASPKWAFVFACFLLVLTALLSGLEARELCQIEGDFSWWVALPAALLPFGLLAFINGLVILAQMPELIGEESSKGIAGVLEPYEIFLGLGASAMIGSFIGLTAAFAGE